MIPVQDFYSTTSPSRRLSSTTEFYTKYLSWIEQWFWTFEKIFSTECIIYTNGVVNSHHAIASGLESPCPVAELPVTSEKVMEGCTMHKTKITGPFLLHESIEICNNYQRIRLFYVTPKILDLLGYPIFLPNGASPQWAFYVSWYLDTKLLQCWNGRAGWIAWPARLSDMTASHFFMCGVNGRHWETQHRNKTFSLPAPVL